MNRIIVVGTTGSGKSKVAKELAEKLGFTYIQMDLLFWEPNWPDTGNKESLSRLFSKNSILIWLFKTYKPNRQRYLSRMKDPQYSHIRFIHLRSRKEVRDFLNGLT